MQEERREDEEKYSRDVRTGEGAAVSGHIEPAQLGLAKVDQASQEGTCTAKQDQPSNPSHLQEELQEVKKVNTLVHSTSCSSVKPVTILVLIFLLPIRRILESLLPQQP